MEALRFGKINLDPQEQGTPEQWVLGHRWKLAGNYHFFTVVMVIYHYNEKIWIVIVTPIFLIAYKIINKYYPGEPGNIHI